MAMEKIKKRDGRIVDFDAERISNAIRKALIASNEKDNGLSDSLAKDVVALIKERFKDDICNVEDVQDYVEKILIKKGLSSTAKTYIIYRKQHADLRDMTYLFDYLEIVDSYIKKKNWMIKENSNMNYSLQGLNFFLSSKLVSRYWRDKIYPKGVSAAHTLGDLHIHNLSIFGPYCVGWELKDLLSKGFTGVSGKVQSRAPRHLRTALNQSVNFFYTLQGESAGAQTFSNFDTLMAPFIRKDSLDYKEVRQSIQDFLFNMNIPTRVGFQTPFTTIGLDLKVPDSLKNEKAIVGGVKDKIYSDFQEEIDLFNKAFFEVMLEGDAKGRPFSFPIPTYNITKDFEWDKETYKGLWEITSKYGTPYFANLVNSKIELNNFRDINLKTMEDKRKLLRKEGGYFGASPLTGSIGEVTINLPRIGYLSKDEKVYFERLDKMLEFAKDSLEIKRKVIEGFMEKFLYPYSKFYLKDVKDKTGSYWSNHFSTIGLVGMHESLLNFMGEGIQTVEGKKFTIKVLDFIRERIKDFQEETGNFYNLEATPAESTVYRLAMKDREKYPDIIVANRENNNKMSENPFYTNSTNLPVDYTDDVFEVLKHQNDIQKKYNGGTTFHAFLDESPSTDNVKNFVKKVTNNFEIPYFSITPTFSICPQHGYFKSKLDKCPNCEEACEIYSRIVGYLRPLSQWNDGKKEEFAIRNVFDKSINK